MMTVMKLEFWFCPEQRRAQGTGETSAYFSMGKTKCFTNLCAFKGDPSDGCFSIFVDTAGQFNIILSSARQFITFNRNDSRRKKRMGIHSGVSKG